MNLIYLYIIYPIIYIFPAYAANGIPVIIGNRRKLKPLDLGKKLNGKRIFGDHKSLWGLVGSLIAGTVVGLIEYPFFPYMLPISILLAIGTNVGDLLGSFIKRRINFRSGSSLPLLDQYGFFIFALIFAYPLDHMPNFYGLIFLVILTGIAHVLTNIGANKLKLKPVPW